MNRLFRSHTIHPFASRSRAVWMASVVVAVLAILLTSTATYASTASTPSSGRTTMTTRSASMPGAILKLTAAPNTDHVACPADNLCLYPETNYAGYPQMYQFPGVNEYQYLDYWQTRSYINNGDYRGWFNQSPTGDHGTSYCMPPKPFPNSRNPDVTGPWNSDQWLLLSTNPDNC